MAKSCRTPTSTEQREEPASEMEADTLKKLQGGSDDKVQMLQREKWPPDTTRRSVADKSVSMKYWRQKLKRSATAMTGGGDQPRGSQLWTEETVPGSGGRGRTRDEDLPSGRKMLWVPSEASNP